MALANAREQAGILTDALEALADAHAVAGGCMVDAQMVFTAAVKAAHLAAAAGLPAERDRWLANRHGEAWNDFVRVIGEEGGQGQLFDERVE